MQHQVYNAENAEIADKTRAPITAFERDYGAKFPDAVAKIVEDADALLGSCHNDLTITRVASR